jgi:hypothetical protein
MSDLEHAKFVAYLRKKGLEVGKFERHPKFGYGYDSHRRFILDHIQSQPWIRSLKQYSDAVLTPKVGATISISGVGARTRMIGDERWRIYSAANNLIKLEILSVPGTLNPTAAYIYLFSACSHFPDLDKIVGHFACNFWYEDGFVKAMSDYQQEIVIFWAREAATKFGWSFLSEYPTPQPQATKPKPKSFITDFLSEFGEDAGRYS